MDNIYGECVTRVKDEDAGDGHSTFRATCRCGWEDELSFLDHSYVESRCESHLEGYYG
jgi:hypothetical protein